MKFILIIFILLFPFSFSYGQNLSGRIMNYENGAILQNVVILNLNHPNIGTNSDAYGKYKVTAYQGDSIRFSLLGYTSRILVYNGNNESWFENITLNSESTMLDTVVIRRELTQFEKDSINNRILYGKNLDYKPPKTTLPALKDLKAGESVKIGAPISGLLGKTTKEYKKDKAFKAMYQRDQDQAFINSRYTPELVTKLTTLDGVALYNFMQAYPMSYEYARQASNLEMMMWIKYNYKDWKSKNNSSPDELHPSDSGTSRKP
jgi:hypothetical protein